VGEPCLQAKMHRNIKQPRNMMRFSARDQRKRYSRMTKASEVGKTVGRWT